MRQSFLFALIVVILGAALYAAYFIENDAQLTQSSRIASTTSATSTRNAASTSSPSISGDTNSLPTVRIGGTDVRVTLADTAEKRSRGLSGTSRLEEGEGMLFVFPQEGIYGFWMKDMRYSIDIIWLTEDKEVVYVAENASPESYPMSFVPEKPAKYVLEVPAGFAKAHNIAIGSSASFSL